MIATLRIQRVNTITDFKRWLRVLEASKLLSNAASLGLQLVVGWGVIEASMPNDNIL
ncbi:MAG: hypothetical protein NTW52_20460 [Planctomycetota bacterium]|nr:hypothetical protein [Planctomycetota bacterium]